MRVLSRSGNAANSRLYEWLSIDSLTADSAGLEVLDPAYIRIGLDGSFKLSSNVQKSSAESRIADHPVYRLA